ncbi:MAG: DUF2971 domain-containing protein [Planctomycetota bacterium]
MPNFLNRYTDLPALIHVLNTKCVTLLDPLTWDDKNDSYFMAEYKERHRAKTLLALCFSEADETYHHWRVFSHGSQGVCIKFDKVKFLKQFEIDNRIKHGKMRYAVRSAFAAPRTIRLEELPFLKRRQYEDEREYRIVYLNKETAHQTKDYRINIDWISRITLSPWLPSAMQDAIKRTLRSIDGCEHLRISPSTATNSERWKNLVIGALDRNGGKA